MTTSVPPSRGSSQLVDPSTLRASSDSPSLAKAERAAPPTTLTLPGIRRRGPKGEAIVVIANPPPYSQLIISFQQDRDRPGPHGVSVAVQAIPYFAVEAEDEDSATKLFDRQSVLPEPSALGPTDATTSVSPAGPRASLLPVPVAAAPSAPAAIAPLPAAMPTPEELRDAARGAQDTYRYLASSARRESGPIVSRWLLVPVACIVASACALLYLHRQAEDARALAPLASVVPKPSSALSPAGALVTQERVQPLPLSRPETLKPAHAEPDERPSARIELKELGLEVTSTPWMEVLIDGRSVGNTPQVQLTLTPGKHDVELLNRDLGLETHAYVNAERGTLETQEIAFE
jgi:hypothetical protein